MDIRNVVGSLLPTNLRKKDGVDRAIKSDSATDREPNGQTPQGDQEQKRPPMTPEQLADAIEHLRNLPVVMEHHLVVELVQSESKNVVLIKEDNGKVVRRILEQELWTLKDVKGGEKGQLLRRTA